MFKMDGYEIKEQIYESSKSKVFKGIRKEDKHSVILKFLEQPTPSELIRYKQEYEITRNLNLKGIIKTYDLISNNQSYIMVLEDFGGTSLKQLLNERQKSNKRFTLIEFLKIATRTTEILESIHNANIIHKDINPSNIVFNPETEQLKIIDFGISTKFARETPSLKNPNVLEGTLAYVSPEQTGRMNRSLDYRTDFYSLGVSFYELLTGQLPFDTSDSLELVHCHLAKQPIFPSIINPSIPKVVSDIIMKLMAKTAESRYQTAFGIKNDLADCLRQFETTQKIVEFDLGIKDLSENFNIPGKLYGRESEIEALLKAFERVTEYPLSQIEMMLILGFSGIGKSSLVAEIHKSNTGLRGFFISGKFDQFQKSTPYSAIIHAFKGLVQELLTETEEQIKLWQDKLKNALGNNAQVIIDVIPEIELILGKQAEVPILGLSESQNRFNLVFLNFIRTFSTKEHPLILFLDDLQWADSATLKLIEQIMTNTEIQYLFLIGAYRDNEVSSTHPLMLTKDVLIAEGAIINSINLAPLELEHVNRLVADTLSSEINLIKPLAELIMQKTRGNPFFVNQFLKTLYLEKLISFNLDKRIWQWDISQIDAKNITDNVVELVINELKKLPEFTREVLRLASCIGATFSLGTISIVSEKTQEEIFPALIEAVLNGFILPISGLDENLLNQNYKFLHDRVQQASYALIDEDQKKIVHLQIGRLLLAKASISDEELSEKLFDIVDHLNLARELIKDKSEQIELAELNLEAGKKAKSSTAYVAALEQYFNSGIEVLSGDIWNEHYNLTFQLYREKSECEYLCGNFEKADELFDLILAKAKSKFDRAEIYNIRIVLYDNKGKYAELLNLASEALKTFGLNLPIQNKSEISELTVSRLQTYKSNLEKIKISELIDAPEMTNPDILACMKLLKNMITPAYYIDQDVFVLAALKMVNLSIEYGNSAESAFGYSLWATVAGAGFSEYETGFEFGKLAMSLTEKFSNTNLSCKVFNLFGGMISPWKNHFNKGIPILRKGYIAAVETGDVYIGPCSYNLISQRIIAAENFVSIIEESNKYLDYLNQTKNFVFAGCQEIYQHYIFNLQGLTKDKFSFSDEKFDELECIKLWEENSFQPGLATYNIYKIKTLFLYEEYEKAFLIAKETEARLGFIAAIPIQAEYYFYSSLILLALYPKATKSEQKEYAEIIKNYQQKMKVWADNSPENFLHKYLLIKAEIACINGRDIEKIWNLYDSVIKSANKNNFIQIEAMANELAAKFWLKKDKLEIAELYMKKAHYDYLLWGAKRKVEDLENKYPQLLSQKSIQRTTNSKTKTTSTTLHTLGSSDLDFATVIKSSQTLASEISLHKLLEKLLKTLLENSGAETGSLILITNAKLTIEATGKIEQEEVQVLQSLPIEGNETLPVGIIKYVERTLEDVVLTDATTERVFSKEPYIVKSQPKSVLCAPIINQGKLIGILYLENNLTVGAFTSDRLKILKLLSSQAAISIENALLYRTLEDKVNERTAQLAKEKERSEQLLLNILPEEIAERLMRTNESPAEYFEEATILFADIVGFTRLSTKLEPLKLVSGLNQIFSAFDKLTEKYGLEKIKTIGDAYMVVGGLPTPRKDHAEAIANMALEMKEYMENNQNIFDEPIQIRIGINTGPVIAGVIGIKKFIYDLWGDAVNISSRMESHGLPGFIQISETTQNQLKDKFEIEPRGKIEIKGRGEMSAYWLLNRK